MLWEAGMKAEFGFKPNPKMGDQLNYALEQVRGGVFGGGHYLACLQACLHVCVCVCVSVSPCVLKCACLCACL